jgi:hypothetical protein
MPRYDQKVKPMPMPMTPRRPEDIAVVLVNSFCGAYSTAILVGKVVNEILWFTEPRG